MGIREVDVKNAVEFYKLHELSGILDALVSLAEAWLGRKMVEKKEFIPKNCGIATREKELNKEFNGYPRGIKNEVMAHFQDGYFKGAIAMYDACRLSSIVSEEEILKVLEEITYKQFDAIKNAVDKNGLMNTDWEQIDNEGGSIDFKTIAHAIAEYVNGGRRNDQEHTHK